MNLEGTEKTFNQFFGIIDLERKSCKLFKFGGSKNYFTNVEMASNQNTLFVASSIKSQEAIVIDSLINFDQNEIGTIIFAKMNIDDLSYSLYNLPSIGEEDVIGLNQYQNETYLASNYGLNYSITNVLPQKRVE